LTSATYLLRDISSIQDLENLLYKIWENVKESLPSDCNGLALEMNDKPERKRQTVLQKRKVISQKKREKYNNYQRGNMGGQNIVTQGGLVNLQKC
jgi:hypothetical protein